MKRDWAIAAKKAGDLVLEVAKRTLNREELSINLKAFFTETYVYMIFTACVLLGIKHSLQVNPGLLVIIEGLEYAGNLEGARQHPILLNRQLL